MSTALVAALVVSTPTVASAGDGVWDAPVLLSEAGFDGYDPHVATVGSTTTAIWFRSDGSHNRVQTSSSSNKGQTWSTPNTLSAAGGNAIEPQLASDGTTLTAVWRRFNGTNFEAQVAHSTDGLTWDGLATVSGVNEPVLNPQVSRSGDTIAVVWTRQGSEDDIRGAVSTNGGFSWSAPITFSTNTQAAGDPRVVVTDDLITVVWYRSDGTHVRIQSASSSTGGSTWSAAQNISGAGQDALEAEIVSDGGLVTVVWRRSDDVTGYIRAQATHSTDGMVWSTPVSLSDLNQSVATPRVATDGSTITVVWRNNGGVDFYVEASSSTDGGQTWSTPVTLSQAGQDANEPFVYTDGATITATWSRYDGSHNRVQASRSTNGGVTWSTPDTLSLAGNDGANQRIAGFATTVTVVWFGIEGSDFRVQASSYTGPLTVERLAGADRYATGVEISKEFSPGVPVAYLATGANYPDALSAASAAAYLGGPLLLTPPGSLPQAVRDELQRLDPALVVIAGGTGVVSSAVQSQVVSLLPEATVRRDSGVNRYGTSRALAENAFPADVTSTAFVATGTNFPDALSASAAAGVAAAPVVLVNGSASTVDAATQSLFDDLGVDNVLIAGGNGAVSAAIQSQLQSIFGASDVLRLSGANRYDTAVAINQERFASARTVFLATGLGYADALAGAALAGRDAGPLYVVPRTCVPPAVLGEIERLGASKVVLFGGTGVLTAGVANLTSC